MLRVKNGNQWTVLDAVKNMFMTGQNSPTNGVKVNAVLISSGGTQNNNQVHYISYDFNQGW